MQSTSSGFPFFHALSKIKYKWRTKGGQVKKHEENLPKEMPIPRRKSTVSSSRRKSVDPIKKEEAVDPSVGSPRTCILPICTQENHIVVDFAKRIRDLGPDYGKLFISPPSPSPSPSPKRIAEPYAVALESAIEKSIEIAFKDMLKIMSKHGKFPTTIAFDIRS
jgi:hypothetical protein